MAERIRLTQALLMLPLLVLLAAACGRREPAADTHAQAVIDHITATRDAIIAAPPPVGSPASPGAPLFITVWDFDGTIISGDCTEGLSGPGGYRGLAERAIAAGKSTVYVPDKYPRFLSDYEELKKSDYQAACLFIPAAFAGARYDELLGLAQRHFDGELRRHYFSSSWTIMEALAARGIKTVIISASPDFFVRGAARSIALPAVDIHGITMTIENGRVTALPRGIVTYGGGKVMKIHEITAALSRTTPRVYVLAGFGNSWHTDGPFLAWIAGQRLPAGKPLAVMINGGDEPEEYRGRCMRVTQTAVTGR